MDVYTLTDAIKAAAPRDTDIGYQKVGWTITNGIKPAANAGGIWTLNALKIAIEQTIVNETPKNPMRNVELANTPTEAVRKHTRGNSTGRDIQPGSSGWPNNS